MDGGQSRHGSILRNRSSCDSEQGTDEDFLAPLGCSVRASHIGLSRKGNIFEPFYENKYFLCSARYQNLSLVFCFSLTLKNKGGRINSLHPLAGLARFLEYLESPYRKS